MAKNTQTQAQVVTIAAVFAEIYWHPTRNKARAVASSKRDELRASLRNGWWSDQSVKVENIGSAVPISGEEGIDFVKAAMDSRQAEWDKLKADQSPDGIVKLKVFEDLFMDEKDKLIVPKYLAVHSFQRGSVYFEAMILRRKSLEKDEKPILTFVPIEMVKVSTEAKLREFQMQENEGKLTGREGVSDADRLNNARYFYGFGYTQADMRRIFKDSMGQKLFAICKLDSIYPDLRFIDRLLSPPEMEDSLPFGPFRHGDLIKKAARSDVSTLPKGETLLTKEDFALYLTSTKQGRADGNKPKIMARDQIEGLSKQSPSNEVRNIAKAIVENNVDFLVTANVVAPGVNALYSAHAQGHYPELEKIIFQFLKDKNVSTVTTTK